MIDRLIYSLHRILGTILSVLFLIINGKIKTAQLKKIPYMLVAGKKEAADGTVAVRFRDGQDQRIMKIAEFIDYVKELSRENVRTSSPESGPPMRSSARTRT